MDIALETYRLDEHTAQIKDVRERLHSINNILVKEQVAWDTVEKNIEKITDALEKQGERLTKLEQFYFENNVKLGMLKTIGKNAKWVLGGIIVICVVFNEEISPIVTYLKQEYLHVNHGNKS